MNNLEFRYFDQQGRFFCYSSEFDWPDNFSKLEKFFSMASRYSEGKVQQYTGLLDKNGQKIFEGDIVDVEGFNYHIEFQGMGFWFVDKEDDSCWIFSNSAYDLKVIGNIFENPELIK